MTECAVCKKRLVENSNYTHAPKGTIFMCLECYNKMRDSWHVVLPVSKSQKK